MTDRIGIEIVAVGTAAFSRALRTAQDDLERFNRKTEQVSQNVVTQTGRMITNAGGNLQRLGRALSIELTAPIALLGGTLLKSGIEIEQSFSGIGKTVSGVSVGFKEVQEAAKEQLGIVVTNMAEAREAAAQMGMSFGELTPLGEEVRQKMSALALDIALPATELNKFGQIAGQFGISAESIDEFTRSIAYLNVATDVAGEEAAAMILQIKNITGATISAEEYANRFGSALVDLGNNSVATEGQILELTKRVAAAGDLANISDQEMLAWATTIAEVGSKSEAGGTAISRVFNNMTLAIAEGGDQLQLFADVVGVSAEEMADLFRKDASNAVKLFLKNLKPAVEQGRIGADTLTDLGIGGVRAADNLLRLSDATELFDKNLARSNKAWDESIALEEEAIKKQNDLASQIQLIRNLFSDLGDQVTQLFKGELQGLIDTVRDAINWFRNLDDGTKKLIVKIALFAAALGPVLLIAGTVISAIGTIVTAIGAVGPVVLSVIGPIGLLVGAFAGLTALLSGTDILSAIQIVGETIVENFINKLQQVWDFLKAVGQGFIDAFRPFVENSGPQFTRILDNVNQIVINIEDAFTRLAQAILGAFDVNIAGSEIGQFLGNLAGLGFEAVLNFLEDFTAFLAEITTSENVSKIISDIASAFADIKQALSGLATTALKEVVNTFEQIKRTFESTKNQITGAFDSGPLGAFKDLILTIAQIRLDNFFRTIENIKDAFRGFVGAITPFVEAQAPKLEQIWANLLQAGQNLEPLFESLGRLFQALDELKLTVFGEIDWERVGSALGVLAGISLDAVVTGLIHLTDLLAKFVELLTWSTDRITDFVNYLNNLVQSFQGSDNSITKAVDNIRQSVNNFFEDLLGTDRFQKLQEAFQKLGEIIAVVSTRIQTRLTSLVTLWRNIFLTIQKIFNDTFQQIAESPIIQAVVRSLREAFIFLQTQVASVFNLISNIISRFLNFMREGIIKDVKNFVDAFIYWINWLYQVLVGGSLIPDLVNKAIAWFTFFKDRILWILQAWINGVKWIMSTVQNSLNHVMYAFDLLRWKIGNVVGDAKWYLDQLGAKVQDVLSMITGSPELVIQHPFEEFEKYLKATDFDKLIQTSLVAQSINQMAVPAPASSVISGDTNVDRSITANISGVPMDTADGIVNSLQRQVRMGEVLQG